jgi:hypothetical protein
VTETVIDDGYGMRIPLDRIATRAFCLNCPRAWVGRDKAFRAMRHSEMKDHFVVINVIIKVSKWKKN